MVPGGQTHEPASAPGTIGGVHKAALLTVAQLMLSRVLASTRLADAAKPTIAQFVNSVEAAAPVARMSIVPRTWLGAVGPVPARMHVNVPPADTVAGVHVQPGDGATFVKVIPAGTTSFTTMTLVPLNPAPMFVTVRRNPKASSTRDRDLPPVF